MSTGREQGWGAYEKAQRYRQMEEARRVVKSDANDPFTYKRPKPQLQQVQPQQVQPTQPITANMPPVVQQPTTTQQSNYQQQPQSSPPSQPSNQYQPTSEPDYEPKLASPPPTVASSKPSPSSVTNPNSLSTSTIQVLCSVLVELFEMVTGAGSPAPKAYGPKGVTLQRLPYQPGQEPSFQLLVYAPVTKKVEFTVNVSDQFAFTVLPDRFASFEDAEKGRSWCIKYGSNEDAFNMARCFALVAETRATSSYAQGGSRSIIKQDLAVGGEGATISIGDQIKCKYSVYAYDPLQPFFIGRILFSLRESAKYIVGAGDLFTEMVETLLIGMRKKSTRLLIIPPPLSNNINANADWNVHIKSDTTLIVEVTVSNIRSSLPVDEPQPEPQPERSAGGRDSPYLDQQREPEQPSQSYQHPPQLPSQQPQSQPSPHTNPEEERGVYNPTTVQPQADLRSRMAALANAQHTNGFMPPVAAPVTLVAPPPTITQPSSTSNESQTSNSSAGPTIESFLADLQLSDMLPNFKREGVTFDDLILLDADELKQVIPMIGPRRRISGRIAEIQQKAASTTATTAATTTASNTTANSTVSTQPTNVPSTHPVISPLRPRLSEPNVIVPPQVQQTQPQSQSAVILKPSAIQPSPATVAAPVPTSSYRPRTQSDIPHDLPTPSFASNSTKHYTQLTSQHQLEALLASEYERGKTDTIALAKAKIQDMKDMAGTRFAELQQEVADANQRNETDREKAREMVTRLRDELRAMTAERDSLAQSLSTVTAEKDSLSEKTQKYVAQMKEKFLTEKEQTQANHDESIQEQLQAGIKISMEAVFTDLNQRIKVKDLYEGEEVLSIVKTVVKNVIKQHQQAAAAR